MKKSQENYLNAKPVSQYTLEGEFVKTYNSFSDAAESVKGDIVSNRLAANIHDCCKGKYKSIHKFIWIFLEDTWLLDDNPLSLNNRVKGNSGIIKYPKHNSGMGKKVYMFNLKGELLSEYDSASQAGIANGAIKSSIFKTCKGVNLTCKGHIFLNTKDEESVQKRIKDIQETFNLDNSGSFRKSLKSRTLEIKEGSQKINKVISSTSKPIERYTLDDQYIDEFPSAKEAERQLGIPNSNINMVLRGKKKSCKGFKFKYKNR